MKRGRLASSARALRNSWMQDVSASSLTTVPFHTEANSSSLRTGCPACVTSALSTAEAFGVSLTSRLPDHRRPVSRSTRWRPKLMLRSIGLFRPCRLSPHSQRNPGRLPGLLIDAHRTFSHGSLLAPRPSSRGTTHHGDLDARSQLLSLPPHGPDVSSRDAGLRAATIAAAWPLVLYPGGPGRGHRAARRARAGDRS